MGTDVVDSLKPVRCAERMLNQQLAALHKVSMTLSIHGE